ncbi:hypothetical protein [Marinomonas primoryensis]|uniref:hypothetical protein n=1 Tax=Marinomonas primoryensis TaxID=178399 RepID=UPI0023B847E9|nr:hypothetical protein [Marinomonas primoryensis]
MLGRGNGIVIAAGLYGNVKEAVDTCNAKGWFEEEGHTGATTYHNTFTLIPTATNWQATPQPKPNVDGPMMATVVGPKMKRFTATTMAASKSTFHGTDTAPPTTKVRAGYASLKVGLGTNMA